jgi:hypothetical protein
MDFEVSGHLHEVDGYLEFKLFAVAADVDARSRMGDRVIGASKSQRRSRLNESENLPSWETF